MHTPQKQILLRVPEAAARLSVARSTLYLMIGRGELPTVHIGRAVRVPAAAVQEWIAKQITVSVKETNDAKAIA